MIEPNELKRLEAGWRVVLVIWVAILASLGVYYVVCMAMENSLQISTAPQFSLKIKNVLFGISCITLFVVHYIRKFLLKPDNSVAQPRQMASIQHPAVAKYTVATVITSVLLESIGIFGVVLFFISKDVFSLRLFLIFSALAMVYFRPRKEELLKLADQIKRQVPSQGIVTNNYLNKQ